jgi:ribosomal protein S18 acetylase RimI-like enzyme
VRVVHVERLREGDDDRVRAAGHLFDHRPSAEATRRFLGEAGHHLLVAYEDDAPAGFVTGIELTHPDKGTEMFLYELGVDERFRRRGIGRALITALAGIGRANGCTGMWVLTDHDNDAAVAAYASSGGIRDSMPLMFAWDFTGGSSTGSSTGS